jgi:c-di-GMP-binding flagellar brake protein YcgR
MLRQWLDEDMQLTAKQARETLSGVFRPDYAIEIGVYHVNRVHWLRSRFLGFGRSPLTDPVQVLMPINADGTPRLQRGEEVLVYYHVEDHGYAFHSEVTGILREQEQAESDFVTARLDAPGTIYRFQRREFLRIRPTQSIEVQVSWEDPSGSGAPMMSPALLEDVSLGGARVRIDHFDLELADILMTKPDVTVRFTLPPPFADTELCIACETVRSVRELKPRRAIWLGLRWLDLKVYQSRGLSQYVVNEQREMLRKRRDAIEVRKLRTKG